MMSPQARPGLTCAHCLQPIADGEHVIFANSEPVHLTCSMLTDHVVPLAAAFLRAHPDTLVCHVCLARTLRITIADARKATDTLRFTHDDCYLVVGGCCGICHRELAAIELSEAE